MFCEGKHDVVFVERSLGAHAGCNRNKLPIRQLPSPFGTSDSVPLGLIATWLKGFAVEDIALPEEGRPKRPVFGSIVETPEKDLMFVLVSVGGKDKTDQALQLMKHVDATMVSDDFDIKEHAVAFLFDADEEGLAATVAAFQKGYGAYFGGIGDAAHGKWNQTTKVPVGLFVFHGGPRNTGTIEHDLAPMVQAAWPDRYAASERFVSDHSKRGDKVLKSDDRRLKAVMTAAGQFDNPGRPLSTVLARKGLPRAQYAFSPASIALADFLTATPWPSGSAVTSGSGAATGG